MSLASEWTPRRERQAAHMRAGVEAGTLPDYSRLPGFPTGPDVRLVRGRPREGGGGDCAMCCAAMALGLTLEEADARWPWRGPWGMARLREAFVAEGLRLGTSRQWIDYRRPAILIVPGPLMMLGRDDRLHAVLLARGVIYDPSPNVNWTAGHALEQCERVFQWEIADGR